MVWKIVIRKEGTEYEHRVGGHHTLDALLEALNAGETLVRAEPLGEQTPTPDFGPHS